MFKRDTLFLPILKRAGKIIAAALFSVIVIIYVFIGSDLFIIREVEVLNSSLIDEGSLLPFKNKNIFLVRMDTLIKKTSEMPEINNVVIKKELPRKLIVEVYEYVPCALLKENIKLAVSQEGTIFPLRGNGKGKYPLLICERLQLNGNTLLGQTPAGLDAVMKAYLSIKDIVPVEIIKVKTGAEVIFLLKNTKTEIRMNSEDYKKEAYYLAALMKQLPSKNVEYIDLRFGEDIIVKP